MDTPLAARHWEDLFRRADRTGRMTCTAFLSPEEQAELEKLFKRSASVQTVFSGGFPEAERRRAFFFAADETGEEMAEEMAEELCCLKITGDTAALTHRDHLGAVLGLGLEREAVGDILPGAPAFLFCTVPAGRCLVQELVKVGRQNVKCERVPLSEAVLPEINTEEARFTVRSLRLDAVAAGLFHLSRTEAAERIERGDCQLNHRVTLKCDAPVKEGDTLSLRTLGKGSLAEIGGRTKKDRIFVTCLKRL